MPELDASERRAIEKLMPFHVTDTLDPEDRERVERALQDDESLRAEMAFLEALHGGVREMTEVPSSGELGLARLRRSVRQQRRRSLVARTLRPALALAAGLILVLQATLLLQPGEDAARLAGAAVADLQVTFTADATEGELRELLQSVDARIVDGPSAAGVYHLQLDPSPEDEAAWMRVLETLEDRPDIVTFVERE
ncbi:MAG: hypothetical protein GY723_11265 [bacterium]|nr:hypothetical protein [bacterium]MCP5067321.1 hypothetical protein [bacterium]